MSNIDTDVLIDEKVKVVTTEPEKYRVILLNDDVTPMDFVINILVSIFKHTNETAKDLTLKIHKEGSAIVGIYTYEIAEQKGIETTLVARQENMPLQVKVKKQ